CIGADKCLDEREAKRNREEKNKSQNRRTVEVNRSHNQREYEENGGLDYSGNQVRKHRGARAGTSEDMENTISEKSVEQKPGRDREGDDRSKSQSDGQPIRGPELAQQNSGYQRIDRSNAGIFPGNPAKLRSEPGYNQKHCGHAADKPDSLP